MGSVGEISYCRSLPTSICNMSLNSRWMSNLSKLYVPVMSIVKIKETFAFNMHKQDWPLQMYFEVEFMFQFLLCFQASVRRKNKVLFSSPQNKGKKEAGI